MSNELDDLKNSLANAHHAIARLERIVFDDDYDDNDYDDRGYDEEDEEERQYEEQAERAYNCKCGAWQFNNKGDVIHVADCCCGAE